MDTDRAPVYLSLATAGGLEANRVTAAVLGGWVAPAGPELAGFEADICQLTGRAHAVALSSGTGALHLGLKGLGVKAGDRVVVPTMTFGATAFAATYLGAQPVFLDIDEQSWNLDADLLDRHLHDSAERCELPAAIIPVDLYGRTADYDRILDTAAKYDIPVLADAAEAVGSYHQDRPAGSMGAAGVFSFNGNKIITTSGGGMLVSDDGELVEKVRFWSTQSREPAPWYQHEEIGYNYRLSNILAALGRAQLQRLDEFVKRRRAIRTRYTAGLSDIPGITVTQDPPWCRSNAWLTTVTLDTSIHGPGIRDQVLDALTAANIEARPLWKPLHLQPVFDNAPRMTTGVAEDLFNRGLCLPSGSALTDGDIDRVITALRTSLHT